jgi:ubiquitin carboxyl-terminal hydrolase L5
VINNACATQAILSVLMNRDKEIDIGSELLNLKSFSMGLPFKDRGHVIGNSD